MRVPSVGLTLEERRIVQEGYALAERMLRDYRDPPNVLIDTVSKWMARGRAWVLGAKSVSGRD